MKHDVKRPLGGVAAGLLAACVLAGAAQAAVVADTLPYPGSPDWKTVVFGGTSMTLAPDGLSTTMATSPYAGVWFGWQSGQPGDWSPGSNAQGNYLSLTASFSADAVDWSAYLGDGTQFAGLEFNPSICTGPCYDDPAQSGVRMTFGSGSQFVALDLTQEHTFEFLLKGGAVSYRIDGRAYTGTSLASGDAPILVIGDGSGTTPTGVGSMTVHAAGLDTAPVEDVLLSTSVPEPGAWALMIAGFGLAGAGLRRRRRPAAWA